MRYLFLDCEMGGRELKYSLLTAYLLVTDEQFRCLGELSLAVKPDDGVYIVSGQGMQVNHIDLAEHDKISAPYKAAKPILFQFLARYSGSAGRLTPVGHGVKGDIAHLIDKLISEGSWEQHCTYHYIDTSVFLQILRAQGKMPMDCDGSISALSEYFGIVKGTTPNWHDAKYDTQMTARVYQKMLSL